MKTLESIKFLKLGQIFYYLCTLRYLCHSTLSEARMALREVIDIFYAVNAIRKIQHVKGMTYHWQWYDIPRTYH